MYLTAETLPQEPGSTTVDVPGADAAWFDGGFLYATVGGRTLGCSVSATGYGPETATEIAAAVLASG